MNHKSHPIYNTWMSMRKRCNNPKEKSYPIYGGRGVRVCPEWDNFEVFVRDVGDRPSSEYSLDRIDNNKGYEPGNVRWATRKQQGRNTRCNVVLTFNGKSATIAEWAEILGMRPATIYYRHQRRMPVEKILSTRITPSKENLRPKSGMDSNFSKLTEKEVREIKALLEKGMTQTEIAKLFNVSRSNIGCIKRGESWSFI